MSQSLLARIFCDDTRREWVEVYSAQTKAQCNNCTLHNAIVHNSKKLLQAAFAAGKRAGGNCKHMHGKLIYSPTTTTSNN